MTPAGFRKLALSFEGVSEVPHMERTAFRTTRKIFATLGKEKRVNLHIDPAERREALMEEMPEIFFSLGGWTRLGVVAVELSRVPEPLLRELVEDAYRNALPVPKKKKVSKTR